MNRLAGRLRRNRSIVVVKSGSQPSGAQKVKDWLHPSALRLISAGGSLLVLLSAMLLGIGYCHATGELNAYGLSWAPFSIPNADLLMRGFIVVITTIKTIGTQLLFGAWIFLIPIIKRNKSNQLVWLLLCGLMLIPTILAFIYVLVSQGSWGAATSVIRPSDFPPIIFMMCLPLSFHFTQYLSTRSIDSLQYTLYNSAIVCYLFLFYCHAVGYEQARSPKEDKVASVVFRPDKTKPTTSTLQLVGHFGNYFFLREKNGSKQDETKPFKVRVVPDDSVEYITKPASIKGTMTYYEP